MTKNKGGRPVKYDYEKLTDELLEYIEVTEIPILAEFCYMKGILRENIYAMAERHERLKYAIKNCVMRKEIQLERKALQGEVEKTVAIFSLKQLGWTDKQTIEHSGEMTTKQEIKHDLSKLDTKELKALKQLLSKTEGN